MAIKIGKRIVAADQSCFIIAEMSGNHGGDFNAALEIVRKAKESGADAVKLQTYRADTITLDSQEEDFLLPIDSKWGEYKSLYSLYEKAYTPWEWHTDLVKEGQRLGIEIFSSPFDHTAVDFLEELDMPAYKIASPEITDIPLIKRVAQTGKPVLLSTGLATLEDIQLAVDTLRADGCDEIVILKCTTAYPTLPEEINLLTISDIAKRFHCIAGISDHTLGIGIPVAAVALGAKVIEKHFVLDKTNETVDSFFSLNPEEFSIMVAEVRKVEKALGSVNYDLTEGAQKNILARRSLYISKDVKKGEKLSKDNVKSIRPSYGLHPKEWDTVLGRKVTQDLKKGDRLSWEVIEK